MAENWEEFADRCYAAQHRLLDAGEVGGALSLSLIAELKLAVTALQSGGFHPSATESLGLPAYAMPLKDLQRITEEAEAHCEAQGKNVSEREEAGLQLLLTICQLLCSIEKLPVGRSLPLAELPKLLWQAAAVGSASLMLAGERDGHFGVARHATKVRASRSHRRKTQNEAETWWRQPARKEWRRLASHTTGSSVKAREYSVLDMLAALAVGRNVPTRSGLKSVRLKEKWDSTEP